MAGLGEDLQLVLALHLADHQCFVETVGAGQEEELGAAAGEELVAEVLEPGGPKGFGRGERCEPGVGCCGGGGGRGVMWLRRRGAVVVDLANRALLGSALLGYAVLDVVEGSAMEALAHMETYLWTRPSSFPSLASAIEWQYVVNPFFPSLFAKIVLY